MSLSIVVATDEQGGIGKDMEIPWHISEDMRRFREITTKKQEHVPLLNCVNSDTNYNWLIMGKQTFYSLPIILSHRNHMILSRNPRTVKSKNTLLLSDYDMKEKITWVNNIEPITRYWLKEEVEAFVVGGEAIYKQMLPYVDTIYLTEVQGTYGANKFFKYNKEEFEIVECSDWKIEKSLYNIDGYKFRFKTLKRKGDVKNDLD